MFTLIRHAISMRRSASVATFCSVALAVAVVFVLSLTAIGVQGGLDATRQRLGADLMAVPAEAASDLDANTLLFTGAPMNIYMDESVADRISGIPGVQRVSVQFFGQTLDADCCTASKPTRLVGFDPASDWVIGPWAEDSIANTLDDTQIVAGVRIAPDYSRSGGKVLGHNVELAAALMETGTDLDDSIFMSLDAAREFAKGSAGLAYLWDEYGDPDGLISCVLIDADDGEQENVKRTIANMEGVGVVDSNSTIAEFSRQIGAVFVIMAGAALLLVAVTLFQLFARFFSLAWDRRSEIALYRALGASRREVSMLIVGEAGVLIGSGVVVGLVLGALLYLAVPSMLASAGTFPFLSPSVGYVALCAVGAAVLFLLVGLVAIAWPLLRAGRIDPAAAMQTGDID